MSASLLVDLLIVLALVVYVLSNMREGFLYLTAKLVAFLGSAVLAFLAYGKLSALAAGHFNYPPGIVDAASFLVLFVLFQLLIKLVLGALVALVPERVQRSAISQGLAIVPAFIDGVILVALVLFVIVASPFFLSAKGPIEESRVGSTLVAKASGLETYLDQIFGKATEESLGFLTVEPAEGQSVSLPYKATNLSTDAASEQKMLELVNAERAKVGAPALVMDSKLVAVARAHSTDMWLRSYFAHDTPDGVDPFMRMRAGGAIFTTAGENLALARTVERAHEGLMNSPGHKRNILDPNFRRVGIGVIDGGIYGKMFTQDFTN